MYGLNIKIYKIGGMMTVNERIKEFDKLITTFMNPYLQDDGIAHLSAIRDHINSRDKEIQGLVKAYREGDKKGLNNMLEYLSMREKGGNFE